MKTIQWTGNEETRVRKEYSGEKFPLKPEETIEVSDQMAKMYTEEAYRKNFRIVEAVVKPASIEKASKPTRGKK